MDNWRGIPLDVRVYQTDISESLIVEIDIITNSQWILQQAASISYQG